MLPEELAPALRFRALSLLDQVQLLDEVPELQRRRQPRRHNRCVVCYRSGVLGGHHSAAGRIQWVHRSCHRRLHRRTRASGGQARPPEVQ